jgi:hypothetical protein
MSRVDLPAPRQNIELLTAVKSVDAYGAVRTKCFGNILELGLDSLLLESNQEQQVGDALTLSLVLPGLPKSRNRILSLSCVVRRVRDPSELHYDLDIEDMDENARQQLAAYLSQPRAEEEG